MVIAADRRQARVIMRYCKGLIKNTPILESLVERDTSDSISLRNRMVIEVHTASFKTTRGYTVVAALCDEIAYWPTDDSAEPDVEILNALRPGMATIPGAMLLCASSPYARRGALWDAYHRYYGKDGPLIWQATTRAMNPTVPESVISQAMERDPASGNAEYLAQFRSDIEGFVAREVVEACVSQGVFERAPIAGIPYVAFADPSGGSNDSFTLGVAHRTDDKLFLDVIREARPPFSPESVIAEFAVILKSYGVLRVQGDRYGGEFPRELFRSHGIQYEISQKPKSDLYLNFLPLLNSRKVELLDHARLIAQLVGLERRTARSGKDSIDHAPGGHDDVANCVAGCVFNAHFTHQQGIRLGTIGVDARITWNEDRTKRACVRWVKIDEKLAPAARGNS